ncbi:hypothetical protein F990_02920 [Acinetobacter tjernbergiae DSM 14971 = CIP 107465]|uniref:Uncharacterized protein n=2 Tax=Acinetobacter tjernbergiae TaxID=202955 RepID=V2UZU6_9GAMM|nr:hypothetical protein F990_02920 [Acinetobacter tjernbergiae DSM 14971 = CIP 107465]
MKRILITLLTLITFPSNAETIPYDEKTFYKQYAIKMTQEEYDNFLKNSLIIISKNMTDLEHIAEKKDRRKTVEAMCVFFGKLETLKGFSQDNIDLTGARETINDINEIQGEPIEIDGNLFTLKSICGY